MGLFRDIVDGLFGRDRDERTILGIPTPEGMRQIGEKLKEAMASDSGCVVVIDEDGQIVEGNSDPSEGEE